MSETTSNGIPAQEQQPPGLTSKMSPRPDHGEQSWVGRNRLPGMKALITGGDSGIGRAVAIAFAREGCDVALSYLPEEQSDAEDTQNWIEKSGARCFLLPGDITPAALVAAGRIGAKCRLKILAGGDVAGARKVAAHAFSAAAKAKIEQAGGTCETIS